MTAGSIRFSMTLQTEPCKSDLVEIDVLIIGAGVIGCAVASQLSSKSNLSIAVLEAGPRIAEGTTSRNSGVIHAGLYYPPESLKAQACIRGNALLYEWAEKSGVPFKRIGKLVVAQGEGQRAELEKTFKNAKLSGASGLSLLGKKEVNALEPHITHDSALWSPQTGVVDPYELSRSLRLDAESKGVHFLLNTPVTQIDREIGLSTYLVATRDEKFRSRIIINCAGLHSDEIARMVGIDQYVIYPCRGNYFSFRPVHRYQHLIYPVKDPLSPGLGVHLTIDIAGRYKLGPDVEYVDSKTDFSPAEHKLESFHIAAQKLFGSFPASQLSFDSCGIRPKLRSPDDKAEKDFVLSEDLPGFINLIGIESPGLTSALALA